jgi:hypothetical protein
MSAETVFFIAQNFPDTFTFEGRIRFTSLPDTFEGSYTEDGSRIHIGAASGQGGYAAGLAFCKIGVAFHPEPCLPGMSYSEDPTPIPNSATWIRENAEYKIRIVVTDAGTYIYMSEYADFVSEGYVLRIVVDSVKTASFQYPLAQDGAWVRMHDVGLVDASMYVYDICTSSQCLVVQSPPTARIDPVGDREIGSSIELVGTEEAVDMAWKLIAAPLGSNSRVDIGHGCPEPSITEYTNRWSSPELAAIPAGTIKPGDILHFNGRVYYITDIHDEYLTLGTINGIPSQILRSDSPCGPAIIYRQLCFGGVYGNKIRFYPDVPGPYSFSLAIFNGHLWSKAAATTVNVAPSTTVWGAVPDMSFIWGYLPDFWRLVDDRKRFEVVWSGIAQFASAELLKLWQHEYAKNLRDVQRAMQRRWVGYDTKYSVSGEESVLRYIGAPYDSDEIPSTGAPNVVGRTLFFTLPNDNSATVTFVAPSGGGLPKAADIAFQLNKQLPAAFSAEAVGSVVRLRASYPFAVTESTAGVFHPGASNLLAGVHGERIRDGYGYQLPAVNAFSALGIVENDFLELDGVLHRIIGVATTTATDDTLVLKDQIEEGSSSQWCVPPYFVCAGADFYNELVQAGDDLVLHVGDSTGRSGHWAMTVLGVAPGNVEVVATDVESIEQFMAYSGYVMHVESIFRRKTIPVDDATIEIPVLQEVILDPPEEGLLREGGDYVLDWERRKRCIRFDPRVWTHEVDGTFVPDEYPPLTLWAEATYLDNSQTISDNFGIAVGYTIDRAREVLRPVDYLSAVKGLWYSYFAGPTMHSMRVGSQILLGLPFCEAASFVEEMSSDQATGVARIILRDTVSQKVRTYDYPASLGIEKNPVTGILYKAGDSVAAFAPIVKGVEVLDYKSDDDWMDIYARMGSAYALQKYFKFLVRVDWRAFDLSAVYAVRDFVLNVRPSYAYPIFVVMQEAKDTSVDVGDLVTARAVFSIYDTPLGSINYACMWDQPEDGNDSVVKDPPVGPIGSPWKSSYDVEIPDPCRRGVVPWGHDEVSPQDELGCMGTITFTVPTLPPINTIFADTFPVYDSNGDPVVWAWNVELPAGAYHREWVL